MLKTKAIFARKENNFEPSDCVIEKTIHLSGTEYDHFAANMLKDYDFIMENIDLMGQDENGAMHCLLMTGEGRQDGILVESEGANYARYSAFIPNAADYVKAQTLSPALLELNDKLNRMVDYIAEQAFNNGSREVYRVNFDDICGRFGMDMGYNFVINDTVCDMLCEKPEVANLEFDSNELIIMLNP